ncbi:MAG: type VII toxin-antitoxin system MntA family adenylyltransferase antitoxin [Desulfurococcales archaeon]|jgi:predicted nucleotidyltransferase
MIANPELRYFKIYRGEKEAIENRLKKLLEKVEGVSFAYIHGGYVKRDMFRDIDIAIWIEDPGKAHEYEIDLAVELGTALGIPVDIHVLNEAPLPFRYIVFSEGRLLFSRNERRRIEVIDETIREYIDVLALRIYSTR